LKNTYVSINIGKMQMFEVKNVKSFDITTLKKRNEKKEFSARLKIIYRLRH
jgi:hypothetical protein